MDLRRFVPIIDTFDLFDLGRSAFIATLLFSCICFASEVYASTVTLQVTVNNSLVFTATTIQNFPSITPGTPVLATSTLSATTNDPNGWSVNLSGDNKNSQPQNNLQLGTPPATSTQITDQTEWVPGAATTSVGNAVRIGSLVNSGNVLAFRVMSASSTNGAVFYSTNWWGSADNYTTDNANTLWAGIASSTVLRQIGNAGVGSYSASAHINTVQYYLSVAVTQPTGIYSAPITYSATTN